VKFSQQNCKFMIPNLIEIPEVVCNTDVSTEFKVHIQMRMYYIKLDLRDTGTDGTNWIQLVQDRVQWRAFVNTMMNLRFP
jgi:hypothetical protein